jgi:uncharacterized damage-inducible protein DinB
MTISDPQLASLFLEFSRKKLLDQYWLRLRSCVEELTDEQVWWRPNAACNSVGNLLLHLNGNVTQWLVASFNRLDDQRDRPAEFQEREHLSGTALIERLDATMKEAAQVLARLSPEELAGTYRIQGYTVKGLDAVYQVVEHFGMHYGQVLYINKTLRGEDLGFHRELNKTGRAS